MIHLVAQVGSNTPKNVTLCHSEPLFLMILICFRPVKGGHHYWKKLTFCLPKVVSIPQNIIFCSSESLFFFILHSCSSLAKVGSITHKTSVSQNHCVFIINWFSSQTNLIYCILWVTQLLFSLVKIKLQCLFH